MHASIASNWRPLSRAFYAFLIASTVLWAIPRNAGAQLYVAQFLPLPLVVVSEYDAKTGATNANFITTVSFPFGLTSLRG